MEVIDTAGGVRLSGAEFPTTKHERLCSMDRVAPKHMTHTELRMYAEETRL